ncbi:TIGR01212 family radical SAM protein [Caloranaerobacter azorensis]|uniref:Radical SAM protein n=2 Tax=Caloranaerobacter azorensis TaxID=116090 RepID=A0A096CSG6_9FIRM|nr:TIGR01212 family radical SAM protein [Caloranaerobacter azorensis]KGG79469.1 radical SAM protein [Caloranaerobacter azorensis H53214]QIB25963.1 TIGR01212 family radical SAM protein [Caloranaerobacter azorensis]
MEEKDLYRVYSVYLKNKYGEKVYKLPINLPITCPNRDGTVGYGGCIFCGEVGAGFESLSNMLSVREQILTNKAYIKKKYKANKFIAYFQNFTNTYMDISSFKKNINEAILDDIVEIDISTRPDCISDKYLEFLKKIKDDYGVNITIELGLQTVNYHTLKKINRGHTLAEFIDSVIRVKNFGFEICTHLILNLPWDTMDDVIENAKVLSALSVDQVKLHSLYIVENTPLAKLYRTGRIQMISKDEYIFRVIKFLEYLKPDIVIQRLIGRAPEENTLFVNWNTSWWKIKDEIIDRMIELKTFQGKKCNYLNGSVLNKFEE